MTTRAADRIDDSYPHGTPAGYRDGCRGKGGCPNRDTSKMTCLEASQRYASDLRYRRAYDHGDIWLDRDTPVDPAVEKAHASAARRAGHTRGTATDPKPQQRLDPPSAQVAAAEPPTPAPSPSPTPAVQDTSQPALRAQRRDALDAAHARIQQLETANHALSEKLAAAENRAAAAEERAAAGARAHLAALDDRREALAEVARIRSSFEEITELNRALQPARRPLIEFRTTDEGLHISLNALIEPDSVRALADHLDAVR